MTHLHYGTLNRFRADINADDLDDILTAPRESVGSSLLKDRFEALLLELFQEARQRYDEFLDNAAKESAKLLTSLPPCFIPGFSGSQLVGTLHTFTTESDPVHNPATIERKGSVVATVSKRWVSFAD
jgi:hypothetical protein